MVEAHPPRSIQERLEGLGHLPGRGTIDGLRVETADDHAGERLCNVLGQGNTFAHQLREPSFFGRSLIVDPATVRQSPGDCLEQRPNINSGAATRDAMSLYSIVSPFPDAGRSDIQIDVTDWV